MNNINLNRRNFILLSAGAASLAAFGSIPQLGFAETISIKPIKLSACPQDPINAAKSSPLVQKAYNDILAKTKTIKDKTIAASVLNIIEKPAPTFMELYQTKQEKDKIYNTLTVAGFIDKEKIASSDKLFPPTSSPTNVPQPFMSAPGSGYQSHHSYPGGLAIHTATNLHIAEAICQIYQNVLGYNINQDVVIASEALHDLAKPWVFQWNSDGSSLVELPLAGTGSHHIFSIVESIHKGLPAEVIVALACAHSHPGGAKEEADVTAWIKCAAMIAQADPIKMGLLNNEGNGLPAPHKQEGYITHLADHDFVLSVPAAKKSIEIMKKVAANKYGIKNVDNNSAEFNQFRNYASAQLSMMRINHAMTIGEPEKSVGTLLEKIFIA